MNITHGERSSCLIEYYKQNKGYLLSFNFNKNKKTGVNELDYNGKKILEVVV